MAASALLKILFHSGMDGRIYFHEIKKHCTLKKLFPATKRSNLQVKTFFLATTNLDHTLLV